MTQCFAFIFFSQIVDNLRSVRSIFIGIEFILTASIFSNGLQYLLTKDTTLPKNPQSLSLMVELVFVTCYTLILIIQLFNWFSKRYLGSVLGIALLSQGVGFLLKFVFIG